MLGENPCGVALVQNPWVTSEGSSVKKPPSLPLTVAVKWTNGEGIAADPAFVYSTMIWPVPCQPSVAGVISDVRKSAFPSCTKVSAEGTTVELPPGSVALSA